jgi:hypothetical protein
MGQAKNRKVEIDLLKVNPKVSTLQAYKLYLAGAITICKGLGWNSGYNCPDECADALRNMVALTKGSVTHAGFVASFPLGSKDSYTYEDGVIDMIAGILAGVESVKVKSNHIVDEIYNRMSHGV